MLRRSRVVTPMEYMTWEERALRLREAGDRIIALMSRCSDAATDEQRDEHYRFVAALKQIWDEAVS